MILNIPTHGNINIDKELPSDLAFDDYNYTHKLEDNFFVTKLNEKTCLVGDCSNSSAFIMELLDSDFFFYSLINYAYPDISYWFFARNEFGSIDAEDAYIVSDFFNFLLEKRLILKVDSEDLKTNGIASENYVYVLPDYNSFDIEEDDNLYLEYGYMALKLLSSIKEYLLSEADDDEDFIESINTQYTSLYDDFTKRISVIKNKIILK